MSDDGSVRVNDVPAGTVLPTMGPGKYETCPFCHGTGRESMSMNCVTCGGTKAVRPERVGLLSKWNVQRRNDPNGKHSDCWTFVLGPKHDPIAVVALEAYATEADRRGYHALFEKLVVLITGAPSHPDHPNARVTGPEGEAVTSDRVADALAVCDRHDALADHWGVARPAWTAELRRALVGGE